MEIHNVEDADVWGNKQIYKKNKLFDVQQEEILDLDWVNRLH